MRLSKAVREQQAAQYLITTLCVWDVEQQWTLDAELAFAWDLGRFDDPYRRVLLPKYPATRQGVCAALAVQFGTTPETLAAHIATGTVFHAYAKPWDVAIDSLGKLTTLVRFDGYGPRLWRVAEGRLNLHQAYKEQLTDYDRRTEAQRQAYATLCELAGQLHPDDVTQWIGMGMTIAGLAPMATTGPAPRLLRYKVLRKCWQQLRLFHGADEQAAFTAFIAAEQARWQEGPDWQGMAGGHRPGRDNTPNCFQALGLVWPCTLDDVKHAYRTLAYTAHPDAGGSDTAFQALAEAYETAVKFLERADHAHEEEALWNRKN